MAISSYFTILLLAIGTMATSSSSNAIRSSHISLSRRKAAGLSTVQRRDGFATQGINSDEGFWFADFSVGGASNLSLLIDTGSGDVVLNPGIYQPGKTSRNFNLTFANTYGTTASNGTGSANVTGKLYSDQISFGSLTASQIIGSAGDNSPIPGSGINVVSECRFGLALTANGTGSLTLGELDTSLYTGDLVIAPILQEWVLTGDLVIGGKIVGNDLLIELDSGTATIVGPIDSVTSIFNSTGIQAVLQSTSEGDLLTGYFPCDKPPTLGFSFPSQTNITLSANDSSSLISKKSSIFNIPTDAWAAANNGNNNCTAILSGQNYAAVPGLWVVGQSFFQGLYIDHDLENGTVGFANLKTQASGTTITAASPKPTQSTSGTDQIQTTWGVFSGVIILSIFLFVRDL